MKTNWKIAIAAGLALVSVLAVMAEKELNKLLDELFEETEDNG